MKQKPAFILDLRLPPGTFDVNVTPDKREIFMTGVSVGGEKLQRCRCLVSLFSMTHIGDGQSVWGLHTMFFCPLKVAA